MGRFFQLRKRGGATTPAPHQDGEIARPVRRGVVNQFRKRVGKPVWPSSTRTRLSIQKPSGSTTTEDTDEVSENKLQQHVNEFVAEVGTDGGDDTSLASGSDDSTREVLFNRSLETIEESLNQSKSQQPSTARNPSTLTNAHSKSISVLSRTDIESTNANVDATNLASTPNVVTPASKNELQIGYAREKLRHLDSLRKTLTSFRTNFQDHAAMRSVRQSPRTPNAAMSFWCQPDLLCSARTAEHLLPIDVSLSLPTSDSTQSWSTSGDPINRTAVSFIDNVLDRLVGQDTQEESTAFGTDAESVMDETAIGESVIFAANISTRSQHLGSTRPATGQSTKIMETLAEWDELDDELEEELGQYDPNSRATGRSLSFEFSESWGYTDDEETEMTDDASAYTTD